MHVPWLPSPFLQPTHKFNQWLNSLLMSSVKKFCFSSDKRLGCPQKNSCHMMRVDIEEDESSPELCFLPKWWRNCSGTVNSSEPKVGFRAPGITALRGWSVHPGKLSFLLELFYWYICLCMTECVCRYCDGSFYIYNVVIPCCYWCCIIRCSVGLAMQWFFSASAAEAQCFAPEKKR